MIVSNKQRPDITTIRHLQTLKEIRNTALKQQALDGGTLSTLHLAEFQEKLDRANEFYKRQLANNDPLTVNADGGHNSVKSDTDWTWSTLATVGTSN